MESVTLSRMPARKHHPAPWDIMRLRLPPGTFARIKKLMKGKETKTEVIRTALEHELQRREKERK